MCGICDRMWQADQQTIDSAAGTEAEDNSAAETADTQTDNKDLREVNVVLDWYPNAIHTFLYTAIERGYFAEEGLDVKIHFPANA